VAKTKNTGDQAELEPVADQSSCVGLSTDPTSLSPSEVAAALASGGLDGLIRAYRGTLPIGLPHFGDTHSIVSRILTTYRSGDGGPDVNDLLARLEQCALIVEIEARAIRQVVQWIGDNPGNLVVDGTHSSGKRRMFPWTHIPDRRPSYRVSAVEPLPKRADEQPTSVPTIHPVATP
jgi:hypothetical protein